MDIADIADPAPEQVKEVETIEAGSADGNRLENAEENKFQRAISAWRSTDGMVASSALSADRVL